MDSALAGSPGFRFVYGTGDPARTALARARAVGTAVRLFGADSARVVADTALTRAELAASHVVLLGGPGENAWTRRLAARLPLAFTPGGFTWRGRAYERPGDAIVLAWPNPEAPSRYLLLAAGNSGEAEARLRAWLPPGQDWRITRDGELVRSGRFAQSPGDPWRYAPELDRDREAERARFAASLVAQGGPPLVVRAPASLAYAGRARAAGVALLERLDALGLAAPAKAKPLVLTLYPSLEARGVLAGDTRPEQLTAGAAGAALPTGREALDLWSVAAARLVSLGASERSRFLEPAGAWLADRFAGEPLARAVARLYDGRLLPTAADAATRDTAFRSPLVRVPARALLVRAIFESAGGAKAARAALLALLAADAPGNLEGVCRAARVPPGRVEARYRRLADSLAREARGPLALARPRPWRPTDGFQRGACLEHTGGLEGGYLSVEAARQLALLRKAGAGWVELSPFAYLPEPGDPRVLVSATGGPDEETDEAVGEAAARAAALGMRVWLAPRLWAREPVAGLEFATDEWPRFFAAWREVVLHWALFAERERIDGLVVGCGMASSTARYPEKWLALIADVRRVYTGTLTYEASWDEVARVPFWEALDLVGVDFGAPLASGPAREPATLRAGAQKAVASLLPVARRFRRPVLVSALGYPALAAAAARPRLDGGSAPDPEAQRACDAAAAEALDGPDWIAGVLWWRWPTDAAGEGPAGGVFSPRGRPAEPVVRGTFTRWAGRPVRVPR